MLCPICPDGSAISDPSKWSFLAEMSCGDILKNSAQLDPTSEDCRTMQTIVMGECGCQYVPPFEPGCTLCSDGSVVPDSTFQLFPGDELKTCGLYSWYAALPPFDAGGEQCMAMQSTIGAACGCDDAPEPVCEVSCNEPGTIFNATHVVTDFEVDGLDLFQGYHICGEILFAMSIFKDEVCRAKAVRELQDECCMEPYVPPPPEEGGGESSGAENVDNFFARPGTMTATADRFAAIDNLRARYLQRKDMVKISWDRAEGARRYVLTVKNSEGGQVVQRLSPRRRRKFLPGSSFQPGVEYTILVKVRRTPTRKASPIVEVAYRHSAAVVTCQEGVKVTARTWKSFYSVGHSVAVSGDTVVAGAPNDDHAGDISGSVFVFVRNGTTWTEQAKLTASDAAEEDFFGESVAISGDTVVVGASGGDDGGDESGSAYIFVRSGKTWVEQAKLTASDAAENHWFGRSVAISGNTVVVGAELAGSAYIFTRNGTGTSWNEQAKIRARDTAVNAYFGYRVAISKDTVVVSAPYDDEVGNQTGSAYVFVRSGTTWTEQAKLVAGDATEFDSFGISVGISEGAIVVGADAEWDDSVGDRPTSGSAYVFVRSGTTWSEQAKLTAGDAAEGDDFGFGVAISGDTVMVGSPNSDDAGKSSGSAYVFVRSGAKWTERLKLTASDAAEDDLYGFSVAMSEGTTIVGAPGSNNGGGYVYVNEC